jgi:hypothetical protein
MTLSELQVAGPDDLGRRAYQGNANFLQQLQPLRGYCAVYLSRGIHPFGAPGGLFLWSMSGLVRLTG